MFGFSFAPRYWAQCNGQLMPIPQNQALFALLGTTFGGNGIQNFALPDLRSRVPAHFGQGPGVSYALGQTAGQETVALNVTQMPSHNHVFSGLNTAGNKLQPNSDSLANVTNAYPHYAAAIATTLTPLIPASVQPYGSGQPHTNIQPYLTVNFCIALAGIFPTRN